MNIFCPVSCVSFVCSYFDLFSGYMFCIVINSNFLVINHVIWVLRAVAKLCYYM